jgi:hypothetical protein
METSPKRLHPATTESTPATPQDVLFHHKIYDADELRANSSHIHDPSLDMGLGSAESLIKSPTSSLFSLSSESSYDSSSENSEPGSANDNQICSVLATMKRMEEYVDSEQKRRPTPADSMSTTLGKPNQSDISIKDDQDFYKEHSNETKGGNESEDQDFPLRAEKMVQKKTQHLDSNNKKAPKLSNTKPLGANSPPLSTSPVGFDHKDTPPNDTPSKSSITSPYLWKVDALLSKLQARRSQGMVKYSGFGTLPSACFIHLSDPSSPVPPTRRPTRVNHRAIFNATHKQGRFRDSTADEDMDLST